jgi:serine/threonine protein kinase
MWSLGVILYMALSGEPPFKGKNDEEILMNIKKG